ncbi:M20 family metallo-hydrolase [Candidatus Thiothrix anitrata]|uniref:M20 family metallo-hydrolase n=1 Tax=Candidatus Thiothrix anitrata TaxID=2823902 RepID=A0ABX7X4E2_9GAMM|nr:M20 family metallo-hydrolase [Candidatus Thiothrix anitrata]QTR50756.1 M20 family metallo-hydrolase [Candidatus Thiothrix anitrata]
MIIPNVSRIERDIHQLSKFRDPKFPGITRRYDSIQYIEARNWIIRKFNEYGLTPIVDKTGNLMVEYGSHSNNRLIAIGSHIDTVISGGKYDGSVGVLGGLEILRCLIENKIELSHNILLIDFFAEESTEFGLSLVGSRGLAETLSIEQLSLKNDAGKSLKEVITTHINELNTSFGYINRRRISYFLELHIEQGPILEHEKKTVGVVSGIIGLRRLDVIIIGENNHAGSTPLELRKDALLSAAIIIVELRKKWKEKAKDSIRITVGKLKISPNLSNVIPGRVEFSIDLRAESNQILDYWVDQIENTVIESCVENDVEWKIMIKSRIEPVTFNKDILAVIFKAAEKAKMSCMTINSGAAHDSSQMSLISKAGMIFIPSKDGKSHCESEFTSMDDISKGVEVLGNSILLLDSLID